MPLFPSTFDNNRVRAATPARGSRRVPAAEAGMTLIEMIVVLAIIALIVPNVIGRPDEARVTVASADVRSVAAALKMYRLDNGAYPTTEQGLEALVTKPTSGPPPRVWPQGGYLDEVPTDPWDRPYVYKSPAANGGFELMSLGRDGKPWGEGTDADIRLDRS